MAGIRDVSASYLARRTRCDRTRVKVTRLRRARPAGFEKVAGSVSDTTPGLALEPGAGKKPSR